MLRFSQSESLLAGLFSPNCPLSGGGLKWTFCYLVLRTKWQTHLTPKFLRTLVGSNGLGPSTSRLSGVCSNQLSYEPMFLFFLLLRRSGGGNRVRTDDPLLAGQVLYQLSYTPIPLKKMLP